VSARDDITRSLAEHRLNQHYFVLWQRHNAGDPPGTGEAPQVLAYLDGGARPPDAEVQTHYGKGLLYAEDARRTLVAPAPPPPPSTDMLDVYRHTVPPGPFVAQYAGGEKHAWFWQTFFQPTLEMFPPGNTNLSDLAVRWETSPEPPGLYPEREMWILWSHRDIQGTPGRCMNFHTHGKDAPKGFNYGNTRGSSIGLSPLAFDWKQGATQTTPGANGYVVTVQAQEDVMSSTKHWTVCPDTTMVASKDQWHDFVARIRWASHDMNPRGAMEVWRNGTKVVNVPSLPTLWVGMGMVAPWQGSYWSSGRETAGVGDLVYEIVPYRIGHTFAEAVEQRPTPAGGWGSISTNGRKASAAKVGTRAASSIALPSL
jgi:hypothetical protein